MKTNIYTIQEVVDYIDNHLEERLSLDSIADKVNYSKYHLSRMFFSIVGMGLHSYIQRRRLSEAAKLLVFTDISIMEVSLFAGYTTQQSFTIGFKGLFNCSPKAYRKRGAFYPLQLKYKVDAKEGLRGDKMMEIQTVDSEPIILIGYKKSTKFGFLAISKCWHLIHAKKQSINHRKDTAFLIGLNDYTSWDLVDNKQPAFDYFAGAQVNKVENVPKGMEIKELCASKYIVFSFKGQCKDSLQPVVDYIYKEWFPQSSCQLNENAKYDFVKYGEKVDEEGKSLIEYWIPII